MREGSLTSNDIIFSGIDEKWWPFVIRIFLAKETLFSQKFSFSLEVDKFTQKSERSAG